MSYAKHTTEAIVLGSFERGEADKTLVLYTEDFGLVYARCIGMRKESSRQRHALQDFSHVQVSLVKGKGGWRIAGATITHPASARDIHALQSFVRISSLVRRLVQGEEENVYLFETLRDTQHTVFGENPKQSIAVIELLCVARVLYALGYLSSESYGVALFSHTAHSTPALEEAQRVERKLLQSVNEALAETQL